MAKLGLNKDAFKRFFSLHVEKIVLGVVVLVLVLFVYRGYSLEGLASDKRPDVLRTKAVEVKKFITDPLPVPTIVTENERPTEFVQRTTAGQAPINALGYPAPVYPGPQKPSGRKRTDPDLYPPMDIEAVAMSNGPVAYVPVRGEVDPLKDDEIMEPKKAKEVKKKRQKRKKRDKNDPYGGLGGYGGEDGGIPGMGSGSSALGGLGEYGGMDDEGGEDGMLGAMPGGSAMGGSGMGEYGGGAGVAGMADPANIEGYRPQSGAIVITRHVVGVTAVIPYKKQWDEFDVKLSNAMGYTRSRDVPTYLGFYAERAEVKDETETEFVWKAISTSEFVVKQMADRRRPYGGWAGFPAEIADPRYVMPGILTMPIPPIVSKSYDDIAIHSKIPRYQVAPQIPDTDDAQDAPEDSDEPQGINSGPSLTGGPGLQAGFSGEGASGMQGMSGYGRGAPGMGAPGMGAPGMGASGMEGMEGMEGYGEEGSGGYGGYGGMGDGMGGIPTFGPTVEYLMVRFFDLSIKDTTKKYRYRIQLWVEDPNHPKSPLADPNVRALSTAVRTRITDVKAKEAVAKSRLSYFRVTEFSEPSAVVSFGPSNQTLGGEISMEKPKVINDSFGNQFNLMAVERSAKVMSVVWDAKRAIEVPGLVDAHRGTFLNFDLDADVVHPVSLQYKTIKEYPFKTNRMVLDFMGGRPLPVPKDEQEDNPLFSPAEFLFLNEKGEFFVKNELDDWDGFKKRLPPVPAATDDSTFGGLGEGEGMGDMEGMGGYGEGDEGGDDGEGGRGRGRRGRGGSDDE